MRSRVILLAALALGACNKAGNTVSAGASDPAANAKAAAAVHFQPGLYQSKVEIKQLDMPGMPPAALTAMKSRMFEKPLSYCLTPEDAAKGAEAMKQRMSKGQCQFERFSAEGGTIDSSMTCQLNGQRTMHAVAHGTFTDTGSVTSSTMDMAMGGAGNGAGKLHIEQVTTTTRTGDCPK